MEKPKCKLCGERHWGICPTPVEAFWRENHPIAKPSGGDFVPPPTPNKRAQMYAPLGDCEYCDRNRATAAGRVKRHREKRKED